MNRKLIVGIIGALTAAIISACGDAGPTEVMIVDPTPEADAYYAEFMNNMIDATWDDEICDSVLRAAETQSIEEVVQMGVDSYVESFQENDEVLPVASLEHVAAKFEECFA